MSEDGVFTEILEETSEFETEFSRCRGLLEFIAMRVLGGTDGIDEAVENCFRTASRNPRSFEYEGEFRSWLVRILVDEALKIRRRENRHQVGEFPWTAKYWKVSVQDGDPV